MKIFEFLKRAVSLLRQHAPPVPKLSASELKLLRAAFDSHSFSNSELTSGNAGPEATLERLFVNGLLVEIESAYALFHPLDLEQLIQSGLLHKVKSGVRARFRVQRYGGLIFFSDFSEWRTRPDYVLPIGPSGHYLALLTIRCHAERALDLGCGCGIQALLASRHSRQVIAIDVNPRALALTRLNAQLNNIQNVETRQGSYFDPIENQRFDLIVANLPFVISPETGLMYRDVDKPGNADLRERLKEIPDHLTEGGFAQILSNWVHEKNQDPSEPIRRMVQGRRVNAWLIHKWSKQPIEYTKLWLKLADWTDPRRFKKMEQRWLRWYGDNHIEQIALGAITLRRRSNAQNWFCSATINSTLENPAGKQFVRLFDSQDYLANIDDTHALLNEIFSPTVSGFRRG